MVEFISSASFSGFSNANKVLGAAAYTPAGYDRQEEIIRTGRQDKITIANQRTGKSRTSSQDLDKIVSYLSNVVDRTKLIKKLADDLTDDVRKSDQYGTGDRAAHFDITLAYISKVAGEPADNPNLLSSKSGENYRFLISKDGQVISLNGVDLGTGYSISETTTTIGNDYTSMGPNPNVIFSDLEYGVLRHKDPLRDAFSTQLPSMQADFVSVLKYRNSNRPNSEFGDVKLESIDKFNPDKVTLTFFPGTTSEESFTGTLSREGLGILNSFMYDSFSSAAGRNRAFNDLRAAKTTISSSLVRFEGALRAANLIKGQKDLNIASFVNLIDTSTIGSVIKLQEADSSRVFKNNFNSIRVSGVETSRNELGKLLGAVNLDTGSNRIIDLIA